MATFKTRNQLLSEIVIAEGGQVTNIDNRNVLLVDIINAIGGSSSPDKTRNTLLNEILSIYGNPVGGSVRNEIIELIIVALGGVVTKPKTRNVLLGDWLSSVAPSAPQPIIWTVNTALAGTSGANQFTVPSGGLAQNYDWETSDGNSGTFVGTGDNTITFPSGSGVYTVKLGVNGNNTIPYVRFVNGGDRLKLLSIDQWGDAAVLSLFSSYHGCSNMECPATDYPKLTITSIRDGFRGCTKFNAADLSQWNFTGCLSTFRAFQDCIAFNGKMDAVDMSSVADIDNMFDGASIFNQPIGSWDTSSVKFMSRTFRDALLFNQPIGSWNLPLLQTLLGTFFNAQAFNQNINSWVHPSLTVMFGTFNGASSYNQPMNLWSTAGVTDMDDLFLNAALFNQDVSNFNMESVVFSRKFFDGTSMSDANYSSVLIAYNFQALKTGNLFSGGTAKYTAAAAPSRANIIGTFLWTITDGGPV